MLTETQRNFGLREDIVSYWSDRAETFDSSPAHGIGSDAERDAWTALISHTIGPAPKAVLELACGTGEITQILGRLGYEVTALDFAEPMLRRARAKLSAHPNVRLRLGDAENCLEADKSFDALISRHLVWTLLSPAETLSDWYRVLRPGGTLVVLDGNWSEPTPLGRLLVPLSRLIDRLLGVPPALSADMVQRHRSILRKLPFADGLTEEKLTALLQQAGFVDIRRLPRGHVARAQRRVATLGGALRSLGQHYVYLSARRPDAP